MKPGSLVYASLQEQKKLNLHWYRNIEALLKLDDTYHKNHVSAFRTNTPNSNIFPSSASHTRQRTLSPDSTELMNELSALRVALPLPSKQFRVHRILKRLTGHFLNCWEHEKATSPKLEYYHSIKSQFGKESYLDTVPNSKFRYHTTRLRISAHDLEVESGRYHGIPRDERLCKWCLSSVNNKCLENESHVLFNCGLYSDLRVKLVRTLSNTPTNTVTGLHITQNIDITSLEYAFMNLLSPNTQEAMVEESIFHQLHKYNNRPNHHITPDTDSTDHGYQLKYYISNALCSYIDKCVNKRWKFIEDTSKKSALIADIAIVR